VEEFTIRPECTIKRTTLKPYSFQFVTVNKILHFAAESEELCDYWLTALHEGIKECSLSIEPDSSSEVLYRESLTKISHDVYYDVTFAEKKPMVLFFVHHE